jgi:prevent-host-death family protein
MYMINVHKRFDVTAINVTELRQHLPAYLKQAQQGQEIAITLHGKTIARIVPGGGATAREAATLRLAALRGTMLTGDVIAPVDADWAGDEGHL